MNRLNAKRIGVLAASLLFGLAVAGPVTFSSIPIINSAGQPVVQIVVGSTAQPSDGVVAANIAAVIGSLSFTSTPITATVGGTTGLKCVVTSATCSLSNQQVWLGVSGVSAPAGTYAFTALIGSVLNRAVVLGVPQFTKGLQTAASGYAYQEGFTTTNSPADSPFTASGSVPTSTSASASSNGGGLTFTSFTTSKADNIMQITNSQFSSLASNWGTYGESESLWLTGFPVYDQQTSPAVTNFAIINAGGAYEVLFSNPIHEPYYVVGGGASAGTAPGVNTINNAVIKLLGQNWTIVSYSLPSGTTSSATVETQGGKLGLAQSLVPLTTVYVGKNLTSGVFTVQLADLGTASSGGVSPAAINIYKSGVLTNSSSIWPANTVKYNISGTLLFVKVNQTFAGLYAYQKWAKIQMYSGVYNVTNGQTFNQTRDPGWNVNLLWVNASGSGNHNTDLAGIVVYNTTPVSQLTPGGTYTFIQNPKTWKVTFVGDTVGTNVDPLVISSSFASSVNYANGGTNPATKGLGNINNITEPAQELLVTSTIPSAFSVAGQSTSSLTYLLTPYFVSEVANGITANSVGLGAGQAVNVVVDINPTFTTANYISATNPLLVTISGFTSNTAGSPTSTTLTFTAVNTLNGPNTNALQATTGNFYNITSIKLSRALPGVNVVVGDTANTAGGVDDFDLANGNILAQLTTNALPLLLYTQTNGKVYYGTTGGGSTQYYQPGQTSVPFTITTAAPVIFSSTNPLTDFFTYTVNEINVGANTASTDSFSFNIVNSTSGVTASPLFQINYSTTNTHANMTYTPFTGGGVNAQAGFRSERGSKISSIGSTSVTLNLAKLVDTLSLLIGPANSSATTGKKSIGPYGIGATTSLPNVTIANVTATCTVTGGVGGCTVSGISNLTATPSVTNATTPNKLNTATTPLTVLDSNANSAATLVVIGSKFVNTVAQQIFAQNPSLASSFNTGSVVLQAFGTNRILVAGYYANQTVTAGNQFIQALLTATH